MPRIARVVIADLAHHVTQRGNGRQFILATDVEREVYMKLLRQAVEAHELLVVGYCLMTNHVHVVLIPPQAGALAEAFQEVHGRYAAYWNVAHATCGHVWQGRFYSCPMEAGHWWTALRYVELNPLGAKMVAEATAWPWSSAAAHCGTVPPDACLDMPTWGKAWNPATWRNFLAEGEGEAEVRAIRRSTQRGRPLGPAEFTRALEERTHRRLAPGRRGRPPRIPTNGIPPTVMPVGK